MGQRMRFTGRHGSALPLCLLLCLVVTACTGSRDTAPAGTTSTAAPDLGESVETTVAIPPPATTQATSTTQATAGDPVLPDSEFSGYDLGLTYLDQLDEMHRISLEFDLMLLAVPIEAIDPVEGGLDLTLTVVEWSELWVPDVHVEPYEPLPPVAHLRDIPETDVAKILEAAPAKAVGMFRASGDVVGIGFLAEDGSSFLSLEPGPDEPIVLKSTFLGDAATWLHTDQFDPVPRLDICEPIFRSERDDTPLGALTSYFTGLGLTPRSYLNSQIEDINRNVESLLESAPVFTDPVTGTEVSPSAQDLVIQLLRVSPNDVVLRGAIPVAITIGEEPDPGGLLVFMGAETGWFLGAVNLMPSQAAGEDGEILGTFYDFVLELVPPRDEDVLVYRRSVDSDFQCPAGDGEDPLLTIPYDDIAGSGRAWVDVDTATYRDYAEWVPPELPTDG